MHYLDNAATTAVADAVADVACRVLREHFANPSSLYAPGARSEEVIETAREAVAECLGARPGEVVFTSCGTDGDNMAVFGAAKARRAWADHIVATGYEHPAVQNAVAALQQEGWRVTLVQPDGTGCVSLQALVDAVGPKTALVAAMHMNNEVGSVLDVAALAARVKQKNSRTFVHVDGVQAWGKLPLRLRETQIDSYAVSGHKVHAPKGVGALYVRSGANLAPVWRGGHQERGLRPGTQNTAFFAALGQAAQMLDVAAMNEVCAGLSARLWQGLAQIEGVVRNSPPSGHPAIANFSVPGIRSETMLHFLEARDVYVSSGSACSKGEASHTLSAMGLAKERIDSAVRVSFSAHSTPADVDALLAGVAEGVKSLARARR